MTRDPSAVSARPAGENASFSLKALIFLTAVEGLAALAWFFLVPSEAGKAVFAGLSSTRLALVAGTLALDLAAWGVWGRGRKYPASLESIQKSLHQLFVENALLIPLALSAGLVLLLLLGYLGGVLAVTPENYRAFNRLLGANFPLVYALSFRALPLLFWAAAVLAQSMSWTISQYRAQYRSKAAWSAANLLYTGFFWATAAVVIAQWVILIRRLRTLIDIPGYYWGATNHPLIRRDGLFLLILLALAAVSWWVVKRKRLQRAGYLLWLVAAGCALILTVGFVSGQGLESLRLRYAATTHRQYARYAVQTDASLGEVIRSYDSLFNRSVFTATKPPGVMVAYIALERAVNGIAPQPSADGRFVRLTGVIAWLFPLVGLLALGLIYVLVRRIISPPEAGIAAVLAPTLFILAPNIILLSGFLDQAVYPSLFLGGALLTVLAFRRRSLWLAVLTGAYFYLAAFMTFAMLPLFAFAILYASLDAWLRRKEQPVWVNLKLLAAVGAGALVLFALFGLAFGYTFFPRFAAASRVVHNFDFYLRVNLDPNHPVTTLAGRLGQIWAAITLNNIEFAAAAGVPVFLLFLVRGVKVVIAFIRGSAGAAEGIQAAFLGTFVALNLLGQMRGEAARLWMFWVPMLVIFAAIEIAPLAKKLPVLFSLLVLVQGVTMVLIFHFQDLHVL